MDQNDNTARNTGARALGDPRGGFKPAVLSFLAYWLVRVVGCTWRFQVVDESGHIREGTDEVFLFAFWHNRIAIAPIAYRKLLRRSRLAALISASRDGELLARTFQRFGFQAVRGSTSRRGPQSLLELVRYVAEGYDAAITPDGPRGPAEIVQPGIVQLARVTGLPITPASCWVSWCKRLHSWDRFIVPLPFARCVVRFGKQIPVPRDADDAVLEAKRLELERELERLGGD